MPSLPHLAAIQSGMLLSLNLIEAREGRRFAAWIGDRIHVVRRRRRDWRVLRGFEFVGPWWGFRRCCFRHWFYFQCYAERERELKLKEEGDLGEENRSSPYTSPLWRFYLSFLLLELSIIYAYFLYLSSIIYTNTNNKEHTCFSFFIFITSLLLTTHYSYVVRFFFVLLLFF